MQHERSALVWSLALTFLALVTCSEQPPTTLEDLSIQAAKPDGTGKPVKVEATDPSSAEQETIELDVRVLGSGFDDGSEATWLKDGDPTGVETHSTDYVSDQELVANISIAADARIGLWDVEVMTLRGKKGIGIESFEVKEKTPPGQVEFDAYTQIDLGTLSRKHFSYARNVSDDLGGGSILIVGVDARSSLSNPPPNGFVVQLATIWEVMGTEVVGPTPLPLSEGRKYSMAVGVSDNGHYISGRVYHSYPDPDLPARWMDGMWDRYLPHVIQDAAGGMASDVNNWGEAAGTSFNIEGEEQAMYWDASGNPTPLFSPVGSYSTAHAINNQGYVAGTGWGPDAEASPQHAILWRPDHTPCDLGEFGLDRGARRALTDVSDNGAVFVVGNAGSQAAVWEVDVSSCEVVYRWTAETESRLRRIRLLDDGWEAVGDGHFITSGLEHPMVWSFRDLQGLTMTPLAEEGRPWGINGDGKIVGTAPVKGRDHAMLWIPREQ